MTWKDLQLETAISEILEDLDIELLDLDYDATIYIGREQEIFGKIELNFTNLPNDLSDSEIENLDITAYKIDEKDFIEQLERVANYVRNNQDELVADIYDRNQFDGYTYKGVSDFVSDMSSDLNLAVKNLKEQLSITDKEQTNVSIREKLQAEIDKMEKEQREMRKRILDAQIAFATFEKEKLEKKLKLLENGGIDTTITNCSDAQIQEKEKRLSDLDKEIKKLKEKIKELEEKEIEKKIEIKQPKMR